MPINVGGILQETYVEKITRLKLEHAYRHSLGYAKALDSDPGFDVPISEQTALDDANLLSNDEWHNTAAQSIHALQVIVDDPTYPYVSNLQEYIEELDTLISQKEYALGAVTTTSHIAAPVGIETFSLQGTSFIYGDWGTVSWPTGQLKWDGQSFEVAREGRLYEFQLTITDWPNTATGIAVEIHDQGFGQGNLIGRGFGYFPGNTASTPSTVSIPINALSGLIEDLQIYPNKKYYARFQFQNSITIWKDSNLDYVDGGPYQQSHADWNFVVRIIPNSIIYPKDFRGDTLLVDPVSGKTIQQAINEGATTTASGIFYSNAVSGLVASDVQTAIDLLVTGGINPHVAAILRDTHPTNVTNILDDTRLQKDLYIDGSIIGTNFYIDVSGSAIFDDDLYVKGDTILGDSSSDTITINGKVEINSAVVGRVLELGSQYTEYSYNINDEITEERIYEDDTKQVMISKTTYSYVGGNITQAIKEVHNEMYPYSINKTITEDFSYDSNDNIVSVKRVVT